MKKTRYFAMMRMIWMSVSRWGIADGRPLSGPHGLGRLKITRISMITM